MYGKDSKKKLRRKDRKFMSVALSAAEACDSGRAAILVHAGRVVAMGFDKKTTHAESVFLDRIYDGMTVYIAEYKKKELLARPCNVCYNQLIAGGVKDIVYTISEE